VTRRGVFLYVAALVVGAALAALLYFSPSVYR
jgi:hypothetical protein